MNRLLFVAIIIVIPMIATSLLAEDVHLRWQPSASTNVVGYKIYYGVESGNYDQVIDVGNNYEYIIHDITPDSAYYFVVRAYNEYGESTNSNEVSWPQVSIFVSPLPAQNPKTDVNFSVQINPQPKQVTYQWNFNDGTGIQKTTSSKIVHQFTKEDDYSVELKVIFPNNSSVTKTVIVKIDDMAPKPPATPVATVIVQ